MKFSYEDKIEMYRKWKNKEKSVIQLAKVYGVNVSTVKYIIRLIEIHGEEIVRHGKNKYYPLEYKEAAIKSVLIDGESIWSVALELGLQNKGILLSWIKSYKENGYTVIERKRGRHGKEGKDDTGIRSRTESLEGRELEAHHRERILKKIRCLGYGKREVRKEEIAVVITELRQQLKCSLRFILGIIKENKELPQISKSDYYYVTKHLNDEDTDADTKQLISDVYHEHKGRYGYRRITLELNNKGTNVNHKRVKRLMKVMGLFGITPKAKYKSYKGDMNRTVKNLLIHKEVDEETNKTKYVRDFSTKTVNEKWTTDVTEFHIKSGKLYLAPILDMYNGEIVSYDISEHPDFAQQTRMLNRAFEKYPDLNGLTFHSDQGWQYQMCRWHKLLKDRGIIQSMSRKGNCLDNSPAENFFGKLKNEMFYGHEYEFESLNTLRTAIEEYIEYYNNIRIKTKLKGLTPCQARNQALSYS